MHLQATALPPACRGRGACPCRQRGSRHRLLVPVQSASMRTANGILSSASPNKQAPVVEWLRRGSVGLPRLVDGSGRFQESVATAARRARRQRTPGHLILPGPLRRGAPSPSLESGVGSADDDPVFVAARLCQVICSLAAHPELRIGPSGLLQPDGHLRGDRRVAVHPGRVKAPAESRTSSNPARCDLSGELVVVEVPRAPRRWPKVAGLRVSGDLKSRTPQTRSGTAVRGDSAIEGALRVPKPV